MKRSAFLSMLILGSFFSGIFGNAFMSASAETIAGPDSDRNLFVSAELWSKYQYNETERAASVVDFGINTDIKTVNDTLPAGFRTSKAGIRGGEVDDLNVTGGIKYSDDIWNDIVVEPVDYDTSSATLLARKLAAIPETEYSFLADETDMQYFTHETQELNLVQTDVAASLKRTWTGSEVNLTHAYLRLGVSFDLFQQMLDEIQADSRWDPVDGMTQSQITAVIDDVVPKYTYGLLLGYGNITALEDESGKSNWDLSNEFTATLDNDTDATLSQFTTNSAMITNAVIGYILETGVTDVTTTSMIAHGLYGPINAPERGPFKGLELGYEINADGVGQSVIYLWYDAFSAVVDASNNFLEGTAILLSNIVPFIEPRTPTAAVPFALAVMLSLAIMFFVILWQGDFSLERYGKIYKGKDGAKKIKTFFISAMGFFIPLILILNTYYSWY
jgi:hypothetical protein